jgi:hypothetical protein
MIYGKYLLFKSLQKLLLTLRPMLNQNLNNIIDRPIYYAKQIMNSAERNYTIVEKETLAMIYDVKNFRHYLLGNCFIFFVHHKTLLYLVNYPTKLGRIAMWLLLLQEFEFKIIYKPK